MKLFAAYTALCFVLKRHWYDLIESGEKPEEYREITPYWIKRLLCNRVYKPLHLFPINKKEAAYFAQNHKALAEAIERGYLVPKGEAAIFYFGYAKDRPQFKRLITSISVGTGRPEWGAEPGREYLVTKLGEKL